MPGVGWSCWMFYILCALTAYFHSVDAGCEAYRMAQAARKNITKDWGREDDLEYEEFGNLDADQDQDGYIGLYGRVLSGTYAVGNGPYGGVDFTETRDRCKREGGFCMRDTDYCRGTRKLYQTQCANECVCCLKEKLLNFSGHKITMIMRKKKWKCARDICRDRGGDLYVPTSINELLRFLRDKQLYKKKVWVGINDFEQARHYEGVHGNKIIGGWMRGQPTRKVPGDDCVAVEDYSRKFNGLRVRPCKETHFFICDFGINHESDHNVGE